MLFTDKKIVITSNAASAEGMRADILEALKQNFIPNNAMDANCRKQLAMIVDLIADIQIDKNRGDVMAAEDVFHDRKGAYINGEWIPDAVEKGDRR